MRRFIATALSVTLALGLGACGTTGADADAASSGGGAATAAASDVTSKEKTVYLVKPDDTRTSTFYYVGDSDVPYVSLSDWGELMTYLMKTHVYKDQHITFALEYSKEGNVGTLTRTDGDPYTMVCDCDAGTITFVDYDAFVRPEDDRVLLDVLTADDPHEDEDGASLFRRAKGSYERYGDELVLDLKSYGIDMVSSGDDVLVPLQTLSDFLLSLKYVNAFDNGEDIFFVEMGGLTDGETGEPTELGELFYAVEPHDRSEAMGKFSYAELCMVFDHLYGLKDAHGIDSFEHLVAQTGTYEALTGTDPNAADAALFDITWQHLDDKHSGFRQCSPLCREGLFDEMLEKIGPGRGLMSGVKMEEFYKSARAEFFPDGVPAYQEVGNTAYITFDEFLPIPKGVDYQKTPPTAEATDTIGIVAYAYSQITREGSPVENVVLDLSCNGGGEADTAIFVISTFLGEGYGSLKNTMTGALATGVYSVDANLDGKFDEGDLALTNKRLFCLTSVNSFSCGNFVPSVFKNSNVVTLMGRTSGGGSCVVLPISTAYGSCMQISGPHRLAFTKNGSFYDIDQGAEPDYTLAFPESYYDRASLTDYINQIR